MQNITAEDFGFVERINSLLKDVGLKVEVRQDKLGKEKFYVSEENDNLDELESLYGVGMVDRLFYPIDDAFSLSAVAFVCAKEVIKEEIRQNYEEALEYVIQKNASAEYGTIEKFMQASPMQQSDIDYAKKMGIDPEFLYAEFVKPSMERG